MPRPNIDLLSTETMNIVFARESNSMAYKIFADDLYFDNWTVWANDRNSDAPNSVKESAIHYSNYVMKLECELAKQDNACGFLHLDHGAIMIAADDLDGTMVAPEDYATTVSNTYKMKAEQYDKWIEDGFP